MNVARRWDSVEDELCAGNDYVIPNGKLFRGPQASSAIGAFPGDSLTIQAGGQLAIYNRGRAVIDWGNGTGLLIQSTKEVNNFIGGGKDGKRADWQSHFEGKVTFDVSGELKFNPVNNLNVGSPSGDRSILAPTPGFASWDPTPIRTRGRNSS